jgi:hypothetical protein
VGDKSEGLVAKNNAEFEFREPDVSVWCPVLSQPPGTFGLGGWASEVGRWVEFIYCSPHCHKGPGYNLMIKDKGCRTPSM